MSTSALVTGITTRAQAVLGSAYKALPFVEDVTRNNLKGDIKGFGVLAGEISQTVGVTRYLTVTQQFQLKIVDRWKSSQAGDSAKRLLIQDLHEKVLAIYRDLIVTKAGSPSIVINILDGMTTETVVVEADGVLEMRMIFEVQYRSLLNN